MNKKNNIIKQLKWSKKSLNNKKLKSNIQIDFYIIKRKPEYKSEEM